MSEYTPTTEEMCAFYTAERLDGPHLEGFPLPTVEQAEAEFNAWLAAHDAEVRAQADAEIQTFREQYIPRLTAAEAELAEVGAGVVAEEPEWEYGERARSGLTTWIVDRDGTPDLWEDVPAGRRVRRRKAGPWVPVKQERAETDA